jgi:hypothetical protein
MLTRALAQARELTVVREVAGSAPDPGQGPALPAFLLVTVVKKQRPGRYGEAPGMPVPARLFRQVGSCAGETAIHPHAKDGPERRLTGVNASQCARTY